MKGIYVLVISVDKGIRLDVGALGSLGFSKGLYAYVGSAQNSLEKRVKRHLRKEKKEFWHIDSLLVNHHIRILNVFYRSAQRPEECKTARDLKKNGFPIKGFGSSDCKCESHLYKIQDCDFLRERMKEIAV